ALVVAAVEQRELHDERRMPAAEPVERHARAEAKCRNIHENPRRIPRVPCAGGAQEGALSARTACDTGRLPGSAVSPLSLDDALFLAAAFCIFVQFAFYPLLLAVVRKTRPRALVQVAADRDDAFLPNVVALVPPYNEADFVEGKLENLASLSYPRERFRVVVVDGHSSDDTLHRVEQFRARAPFPIDVVLATERGKIPQLNEGLGRIAD